MFANAVSLLHVLYVYINQPICMVTLHLMYMCVRACISVSLHVSKCRPPGKVRDISKISKAVLFILLTVFLITSCPGACCLH